MSNEQLLYFVFRMFYKIKNRKAVEFIRVTMKEVNMSKSRFQHWCFIKKVAKRSEVMNLPWITQYYRVICDAQRKVQSCQLRHYVPILYRLSHSSAWHLMFGSYIVICYFCTLVFWLKQWSVIMMWFGYLRFFSIINTYTWSIFSLSTTKIVAYS